VPFVLDLLVRIPAIKVIGRTSSFQFKGKNEDLRTIGTKLGVAYVLEGSVRKSGNRLRVTTQLIDTRDGTHRWSEHYDRDIGDVLTMQDEIAAAIVRTLQITFDADTLQSRPALKNTEAYNLYLRGRYAYERVDKEGFEQAANYFQQAVSLDPTFATALGWLALTYAMQAEFGISPPGVAVEQARRSAKAALNQDPNLALAHTVLGAILTAYDWDWPAADAELKRALTLAPRDIFALWFSARLALTVGRWDDALALLDLARVNEPLTAYVYQGLGWIQVRRGQLAAAEAAARKTLELNPTYVSAHYYLGLVLLARGQREAALAEMRKESIDGDQSAGLAMAYYSLGRTPESDASLAIMIKEEADDNAFGIAEVYAYRGKLDEALRWLDRAYAQRDPSLHHIKGDLPLRGLETNARFKAFLRKMNLPE
jgi:tetratricopeptide (TPR) repeat protein